MASLNAGPEYYAAEGRYSDAVSTEEKLAALEAMLKHCPKHKSAQKILNEIKTKIARLRKQQVKQAARKKARGKRSDFVKKQGAAQVVLLGQPNSGKSFLLNLLTNARTASSPTPFETKSIVPGMMKYEKVQVQILDMPSVHDKNKAMIFSIARNADLAVIVLNETLAQKQGFFHDLKAKKALVVRTGSLDKKAAKALRKEIFEALEVIRVFTKSPRSKPDTENPVVLSKSACTVAYAARQIHKDFAGASARVWGSTKFPGQQVGPDYVLKDGDVIELRLK